jgi:hypothetical protein
MEKRRNSVNKGWVAPFKTAAKLLGFIGCSD